MDSESAFAETLRDSADPTAPPHGPLTHPVEILRHEKYDGPRYSTGIASYDELLGGGIAPGFSLIIGGEPWIGKTTREVQILAALLKQGVAVAGLFGDEDRAGIATRLGQCFGFRYAELGPSYPGVLSRFEEALSNKVILLLPGPDDPMTIEDAEEALVAAAPPGVPRALFIDSLQTVASKTVSEDDSPRLVITKNVDALKLAKRRSKLIVVATSEVSRAAYASPDASQRIRPLAAFAESRAPEYRFDIAEFLSSGGGDTVKCELVKNRLGHLKGSLLLHLDRASASFMPIDPAAHEEELKAETARRDTEAKEAIEKRVLEVVGSARDRSAGRAVEETVTLAGGRKDETRAAVVRLVDKGVLEFYEPLRGDGQRGPTRRHVRWPTPPPAPPEAARQDDLPLGGGE